MKHTNISPLSQNPSSISLKIIEASNIQPSEPTRGNSKARISFHRTLKSSRPVLETISKWSKSLPSNAALYVNLPYPHSWSYLDVGALSNDSQCGRVNKEFKPGHQFCIRGDGCPFAGFCLHKYCNGCEMTVRMPFDIKVVKEAKYSTPCS